MKRHWKDPVNGLTAFFSEESYTRVLGSVSLQERLATKLEEDGHCSHLALPSLSPYQVNPTTTSLIPKQAQSGPPEVKKDDVKEARTTQGPNQKVEETQVTVKKIGQSTQRPKAQKSALSSKEQRRYLELFHKYLMSYRPQQPSPAEIKELTEFEGLQVRVSSEQAAFLLYTEQVSKSRHFDYNHLLPAARKYVDEKLRYQWRRVDHYARYYVPDKQLPLVVMTDKDYSPTLLHDKTLLELGTFPKVFIPDMTKQNEVPTQYDKVNKRFPSNGRKTTNSKAWNHEACSKDTNCEILAQRHGTQLVTCISALRCLVDNHAPKFDREWEIPVVIRQYEHDYGDISTKQKVVYIDKPFASKVMSNREKNTLYHKYALKSFITQPSYPRGHRHSLATPSAKADEHKKVDSANPFDNDINMEDLETFGSFDIGKPTKRPAVKKSESSASEKLESFGLLTLTKGKSGTNILTGKGKSGSEKSQPDTSAQKEIIPECDGESIGHDIGGEVTDAKKEESCDKTLEVSSVVDTKSADKELGVHMVSEPAGPPAGKPAQTDTKASVSGGNRAMVRLMSSSGGDTSHDESLVIDLPDLQSPPTRTTRARAKKNLKPAVQEESTPGGLPRRSSQRLVSGKSRAPVVGGCKTVESVSGSLGTVMDAHADSTDEEAELVIDLGESLSSDTDRRRTRSQASGEFPVPKRVLRKRKSTETRPSVESDSDGSPERQSVRLTRAMSTSASRSRSRSNSETNLKEEIEEKDESGTKSSLESRTSAGDTKSVNEESDENQYKGEKLTLNPETSILISPSKVDNIMIKTSTDDLSGLPPTAVKVPSPQKPGGKRSRVGHKTGLTPLDSILKLQEKMLPTGKAKSDMSGHTTVEDLSEFHHPEEHNVSYNLWTFSGLSVLTRSSCHGICRDLTHKAKPVCIVPKLEYQAKFGVEQVTQSEVARDWISCYVKPNTKLVRGRINALTSEVIKLDELDFNAIVNPSLSFVPGHALGFLHNLFLRLTELPVGQYILSHSKGDNSCQLMKNTENKRGSYDLKFSYMGFGPSISTTRKDDEGVPWIPIDPTVLLPVHRRQGRIPCTFEPADFIPLTVKKSIKKKKKKKKQWQGKGVNRKT